MRCKFCGKKGLMWSYTDAGWHMDEEDGSYHACRGQKLLDQTMVNKIIDSVSISDKWLADRFIKKLALYRYLRPRAKISPELFINGRRNEREILGTASDSKFAKYMRLGTMDIYSLQADKRAEM